jgi:hypothetical protein
MSTYGDKKTSDLYVSSHMTLSQTSNHTANWQSNAGNHNFKRIKTNQIKMKQNHQEGIQSASNQ